MIEIPAPGLVRREWDGEAVIHVEATGDTHLYDAAMTVLLDALPAPGADRATWAERARAALGDPDGFDGWFPLAVERLSRDRVVVPAEEGRA